MYANWAPGEPSGPSPAPSGNKPVRMPSVFCSAPRCPKPVGLPLPQCLPLPWGLPSSSLFAHTAAFWGQ